jgi:transcriptional regulator with XRE-family HTH domain
MQAELAKMTGMSRSHIYQIEQGNRSISLLNLISIATTFELPVSSLLAPLETSQALKVLPSKDIAEG